MAFPKDGDFATKLEPHPLRTVGNHAFPDEYRNEVFMVWYRSGKVPAVKLYDLIPVDQVTNKKPEKGTLAGWIQGQDFQLKAQTLDDQVQREIEIRLVHEKVEMLNRHAELGRYMQDKAKDYLEDHWDEIKPANAIKLLLAAITIERESRGIAAALEKMTELSDDKLLEQAMQLLKGSEVSIEPYTDETEIIEG